MKVKKQKLLYLRDSGTKRDVILNIRRYKYQNEVIKLHDKINNLEQFSDIYVTTEISIFSFLTYYMKINI